MIKRTKQRLWTGIANVKTMKHWVIGSVSNNTDPTKLKDHPLKTMISSGTYISNVPHNEIMCCLQAIFWYLLKHLCYSKYCVRLIVSLKLAEVCSKSLLLVYTVQPKVWRSFVFHLFPWWNRRLQCTRSHKKNTTRTTLDISTEMSLCTLPPDDWRSLFLWVQHWAQLVDAVGNFVIHPYTSTAFLRFRT